MYGNAHWLIKYLLCQVVESLRQGHQAMVFVHSRKDTAKTAQKLVYALSFWISFGWKSCLQLLIRTSLICHWGWWLDQYAFLLQGFSLWNCLCICTLSFLLYGFFMSIMWCVLYVASHYQLIWHVWQVELARKFEGLELFKNDQHSQFSLIQAPKNYLWFSATHYS